MYPINNQESPKGYLRANPATQFPTKDWKDYLNKIFFLNCMSKITFMRVAYITYTLL